MRHHPAPLGSPAAPTESGPLPPHESRNPRAERWIVLGWILIATKCVGIWWAIGTYHIPIHPLWLIGPTLGFGLLATMLYLRRY